MSAVNRRGRRFLKEIAVTMTRPPEAPAGPGPGSGPGRAQAGLRVAGFRIRLTLGAKLLAVLAVLAGAFALPRMAPGLPAVAYLAATAALAGGFLISLVAHELAHAVVARRYGAEGEDLPVGFLGGASHARHDFRTPRALGRVAAAGLLATLGLAAAGVGAALGLAALGAGRLPFLVFAMLAWLNLVLTVVNALPAAGLDGGRVVHAVFWKRSGDRAGSAVSAAKVGQFTGALLVAGGVALLALGYLDGIWAGLIGLVMVSTSRAWAREVLTITALAGLRVRDILAPAAPVLAPGWQSVEDFLRADGPGADAADETAAARGQTAFPVRDFDGTLAGLVTLSQLATVPAARRDSVRIAQVATPLGDVVTTTPEEKMNGLVSRLTIRPSTPAAAYTAGHALVVDGDGAALGVLTPADFARASQLGALHTGRPGP